MNYKIIRRTLLTDEFRHSVGVYNYDEAQDAADFFNDIMELKFLITDSDDKIKQKIRNLFIDGFYEVEKIN